MLLDPRIEDAEVRSASFARVPERVLREAVAETQGLIRPRPDDAIDFLGKRYAYLRQFVPSFLQTLTLRAQGPDDSVLRAVEIIRGLDHSPTRPSSAQGRTPDVRQRGVASLSPRGRRRSQPPLLRAPAPFGICAAPCAPAISGSNRADAMPTRIPTSLRRRSGPAAARKCCARPERPATAADVSKSATPELEACMARVEKLLATKDSPIQIEDGTLVLSPLEADRRPDSAEALEDLITARLPRVELSDLPASKSMPGRASPTTLSMRPAPRRGGPLCYHISTPASWRMPAISASSKWPKAPTSPIGSWLGRRRGTCAKRPWSRPLSVWSTTITSCPSVRRGAPESFLPRTVSAFRCRGKSRHARSFPPTLGYGQGLTFYSWTSDQLSQYGSKPVIITARDATYVLDAILGNETELALLEHTTDTAGATEMIFALFDLLGLRFTPRLRDIGKRRLYRSGAICLRNYPRLRPAIKGRINRQRVLDWWDEMLRVAGSMKLGHVTASLLLQKLQAYPQQNALAQALQEYGRLIRTLHVLRWYANKDDRRRVMRQLNKGESLHDLRAYLMIANKGHVRRNRGEDLGNQASCLLIW